MSSVQLKEDLTQLLGTPTTYSDDPMFWFKLAEWSCDPESMTHSNYTVLWRILYYIGDVDLIRSFMQYLLGEQAFCLGNKIYEKDETAMQGDFVQIFKVKEHLESYLDMVPQYREKLIAKLEEQKIRDEIDNLAQIFLLSTIKCN